MPYQLNEKVMYYGRPAYVVGKMYTCKNGYGAYYDLCRDLTKRKIEFFYIPEKDIKPCVEPSPYPTVDCKPKINTIPRLVKA